MAIVKPRMRIASLAAGAMVAAGLAFAVAAPAQAHNFYVSSTPGQGETLTELPENFVVTTNAALLNIGGELGGFAIQVTDADGLFYGDGCITVDGASMSTPAGLGEPGDYVFTWQAVSEDSHTISGSFEFSWQPAQADVEVSAGSSTAPVCGVSATESPEPTTEAPSAPADPEPAEAPQETAATSELLWIGGALAAVIVAGAVTMIALSRKKP